MARTIALMNQKGGVGKTTTAVNLAAGIAAQGRRVLLIDLDPQAHASLHLGVDPSTTDRPTVYDLLMDPRISLADVAVEARPNLLIAPAETDLAGVETELSEAHDRALRLRKALDAYLAGPDAPQYVLMDCPPSLGVLTLNGLAAVREVFIPMQAHFLALQGVAKLMQTVALMGRTVNPHLHVTGVVLCVHDTTTTHSKEVVGELDSFFAAARNTPQPWSRARVYRPAVRRTVKAAEAPSFGQTIFEYAPTSPAAQDYKVLAEAMVREWDELLVRRALSEGTLKVTPSAGPSITVNPQAPSTAAAGGPTS